MALWGVLIVLSICVGNGFELESTYSAFSDLVTEVRIGDPGRSIKMSLDFSDKAASFVYDGRRNCPAFVGECYDPEFSSSHVMMGLCSEPQVLPGWSACMRMQDSMELVSEAWSFRLLAHAHPTGPRYREVAGILSMNRHMPWIDGKTILIERTDEGVSGFRIKSLEEQVAVVSFVVPILDELDSIWAFEAEIEIFNELSLDGPVVVEFDPNNTKLVLPVNLFGIFITHLESRALSIVPDSGSIRVPCDLDLDLALTVGDGNVISIPNALLIDSKAGVCHLRIQASVDSDRVVIGRQLFGSVETVVLDDSDNTVGFVFGDSVSAELSIIEPMIPIFSPDLTYGQFGHDLDVFHISAYETRSLVDSFFLVSRSPRVLNTEVEVLQLLPVGTVSGPGFAHLTKIEGSWILSGNPLIEEGKLMIRFEKAESPHTVFLELKSSGISIWMIEDEVRPVSIDELGLPDPQTQMGPVHPDFTCGICRDPIEAGQEVQPMQGCMHPFHFDCIRHWLENYQLNCPLCRQSVLEQ